MRPSSSEMDKEDFSKLLPESMMRDEEEVLAGTRSLERLNAAARNVGEQFEKEASSNRAAKFMTS